MAAEAKIIISAEDKTKQAFDSAKRNISALTSAFTSVKGLASGFAAIAVAQKAISSIDVYTKFNAQLKLATRSQEEFAIATEDVSKIARVSQSDISSIGTLYARINNSVRDLGASQKDTADITENVALALKISGATATETSSAVLQLSQAFGSGVLRGEEFNAVNEAAPALMRALAESMGVPVGKLKELASNGQITSDVLLRAFGDDTLLEKFREQAKEVQTIAGGWEVFTNQLTVAIGKINETTGASKILIGVLENAATLLSVFEGGEKGSILRNSLDAGKKAREKQLAGFDINQLKGLAGFNPDAKEELKKRLALANKPFFSGVSENTKISPNFSAAIEAQDINKIHAEQERLASKAEQERLASKKIKKFTSSDKSDAEKAAEDVAKLIESFQSATEPTQELSEKLQAQLDVYRALDPGVNKYLQGLIDQTAAQEDLVRSNQQIEEQMQAVQESEDAALQRYQAFGEEFNTVVRETEDLNLTLIKSDEERAKKQLEIDHDRRVERISNMQLEADEIEALLEAEGERFAASLNKNAEEAKKTKDIGRDLGLIFSSSFEDAIVKGEEFGDVLKSLAQDLIKLATRKLVTEPLLSAASDVFGSIFSNLGFASGGRPPLNKASMVGENGPELFVPDSAGTIVPNHALGGGGNYNVVVNVDATGGSVQGDNSKAGELGRQIEGAVRQVLLKEKRPGGMLV
jgi:tape measure domain-containing protein